MSREKAWWSARLSSSGITVVGRKSQRRYRILALLDRDPTRLIDLVLTDKQCDELIESMTRYRTEGKVIE